MWMDAKLTFAVARKVHASINLSFNSSTDKDKNLTIQMNK